MTEIEREMLAAALRGAREASGMSAAELAAHVGVIRQAIYQFESGSRLPSLPTLLAVCRATGTQPGRLLNPLMHPARRPKPA